MKSTMFFGYEKQKKTSLFFIVFFSFSDDLLLAGKDRMT